jgi:hypothetical protein
VLCTRGKNQKRVWNYFIRHAQLTILAKKYLTKFFVFLVIDQRAQGCLQCMSICLQRCKDALLELHGIKPQNETRVINLKSCPRCAEQIHHIYSVAQSTDLSRFVKIDVFYQNYKTPVEYDDDYFTSKIK